MTKPKHKAGGPRHFERGQRPQPWMRDGAPALFHFIMSYHDAEPVTVCGDPYRLASGDWLVPVRRQDGRTLRAAVEALDPDPSRAEEAPRHE